MKKALILIALMFTSLTGIFAQPFNKKDLIGGIGTGLGYPYLPDVNATALPPLFVFVDKGAIELRDIGLLSIGGAVGFKYMYMNTNDAGLETRDSWSDMLTVGRAALHVDLINNEDLDTYVGIGIGLKFQLYKDEYPTNNNTKIETQSKLNIDPLYNFYVGGRYYFSRDFGAFGELGYNLSYITGGICYRFK
jgi:hypothetical protein